MNKPPVYKIEGKNMQVISQRDRFVYYDWPPIIEQEYIDPELFIWWPFTTAYTTQATSSDIVRNSVSDSYFYSPGGVNTGARFPYIVSRDIAVDGHLTGSDSMNHRFGRRFNHSNFSANSQVFLSGANQGDRNVANAMFESSSYTCMFWYRKTSGSTIGSPSFSNVLVTYGSNSTTSNAFRISFGSTSDFNNKLCIAWISGTAITIQATASDGIYSGSMLDQWQHIAVKRDRPSIANPQDRWDVSFYMNGAVVGRAYNVAMHARRNAVDVDGWSVGSKDQQGVGSVETFSGDFADFIFYSSSLTDDQIYTASISQTNRVVDTNIYLHWPFDEKPIFDRVGSHHITPITCSLLTSSVTTFLNSVTSSATIRTGFAGPTSARLRELLTGSSYTLQFWMKPKLHGSFPDPGIIFRHGCELSQNTTFGRAQLINVTMEQSGSLSLTVPSGSANTLNMIPLTCSSLISASVWTNIAIRKTLTTFPSAYFDFFINGELKNSIFVATGSYDGSVDIGKSGSIYIATDTSVGSVTIDRIFEGDLHDMRVYSSARTNYQIQQVSLSGTF